MTLALQIHVERFLQLDVSAEPDTVITQLLESASGLVESFVGRTLEETTHTEDYDLPDGAVLILNHTPVTVLTSVTLNTPGTVLVLDTDVVLKARYGQLIRTGADRRPIRWNRSGALVMNEVEVVYDAGYDFTVDPLLERDALVARDTTTRIASRAFQAAAAAASVPVAALGIKSLELAGSDKVTYRNELADVATAAVQLTDDDKTALRGIRRKVLAS
jgi:hypothetical protein